MLEGGVWVVLRKLMIEFGRHIPTKPMDVSEGNGEIERRKRAEWQMSSATEEPWSKRDLQEVQACGARGVTGTSFG